MPTTRADLQRLGFTGFVAFRDLPAHDVPRSPGVYAVVRELTALPRFLPVSRGGHFKGHDPTVPVETLQQAWVAGVQTVYIGKAGPGANRRRGLRQRLEEYRRFGQGHPVGHRGGRYIWQLPDADSLLVGWMTTPDREPGEVEAELIDEFTRITGRRPFANRNRGRRPPRAEAATDRL